MRSAQDEARGSPFPTRVRFIRRFLPALALLTPATLAAQAITPAESARIDGIVATALARTGVPSASIAVVRGDRLVFTRAYGKASEAIPVATPALPYQIASISKQFTAAAILLLARDRKLSLDDTVAKYVPGVTQGDRITIRQLLSHTSGLQDYWPQDYGFADMARPTTPQAIVARWARKPLDFQPGTQWQYSNTGYVVAGLIVERVAGEPLLAFLQRRVFRPLDIRAVDQDLATGAGYPQGYERFALGPVRVERPAAHGWLFAAGELAMSASDLAKWDIARIDRTLLSPADWQAQETAIKLADGPDKGKDTGYGLGVDVGVNRDGRRFVEHSGEAVGFLTENIVYPDDRAAVIVFTNADFSDAYKGIAASVYKVVLPAPAPAAGLDDAMAAIHARAVFDALRAGTLDRSTMTANSNFYFTPTALADYRASLGPLGRPTGFEPTGPAKLRGGFVNRNYRVTYPGRTLAIVSYAEPGAGGKYEQFLVMPSS
ncbi:serine hydrolase domain-containing protein [Sphingomonas bacterium]|uniref:serine hydrolase domain-containing protein n=1 Tax=Sphingomonas bacterium TaxID=1895847 RepID=UPI0020C72205|nr:serine hydrolase domain-containing protein [Sphingomonas bacterium]